MKPQDILILLKLISLGSRNSTYAVLAKSLHMSPSEVHAGLRRAQQARLYAEITCQPIRRNLSEFLIHGAKYAFPPVMGSKTRGVLTSYAAPVFSDLLEVDDDSLPPVWPSAEGEVVGLAFAPLYKSVPLAAAEDSALYDLLCLVDAIRSGKVREQALAADLLESRIIGTD